MKGKPRILIIDNSKGITGAFKSIRNISEYLSSQFSFHFAIPRGSENLNILQRSQIEVVEASFIELSKSLITLLYFPRLFYNALKINKYVNQNNIDIIHVNDIYNLVGIIIKLINPKVKLVHHVRLLPSSYIKRFYKLWKKLIEKYADKIVCVSKIASLNFREDKTVIIYDSIVIPLNDLEKKEHKKNKCFEILVLANYIPGKGHKQAIEAFELALPSIGNSKLVFHGGILSNKKNRTFKESLKEYVTKKRIAEYVEFNGLTNEVEEIISNSDLMLNFSESESFSMSTLEALAFGTPIIATKSGGPSEIIENGVTGILVEVNNIQAMSNSIIGLVKDVEKMAIFSKNGLSLVQSKFSLKKQSEQLSILYTGLLMG